MGLYFSDVFKVPPDSLEDYGAFNVSLLTDLPLFIDPFLLFNSENARYQELHNDVIRYLKFLRDKSTSGRLDYGLLQSWFFFSEVKQTWLGFTLGGNSGRGLGHEFATALHRNLGRLFESFGNERITKDTHLEKLTLISGGVGRDRISDFTTNLIKPYLLEYTESFAKEHVPQEMTRRVTVGRVRFNYTTETWERCSYVLPVFRGDFVLLTPKDILTKDDTWINGTDYKAEFFDIPDAIPDETLRAQVNNYIASVLEPIPPEKLTKKALDKAIEDVTLQFPVLLDYFIRNKEDTGDLAVERSLDKVEGSHRLYVEQYGQVVQLLWEQTKFYQLLGNTRAEAYARVMYLKDVIENKGGWRVFYLNDQPIRREEDLQIFFRLTWFGTPSDVSREVNDGRGPADFKISRGSLDKTIVEFKLASNPQLAKNLAHQVEIYKKASDAQAGLKVIVYFSEAELRKVKGILSELGLSEDKNVILVDARRDNKPSASVATSH